MRKWILAALCSCLFIVARSEITNTVSETECIMVTATRSPERIRTLPGNPSVILAEELADGYYASVPEALQKKAGLFFRSYADHPSQASVDLRGFGGDNPQGKTLILLNGRKLNRPDMAIINWAQIPMQAVERIEVVRGPNSVLYGDHAIGGVINVLTKEATETPETSLNASIRSDAACEQNLVTSGKLNELGYVTTVGHQSGDGYRDRSAYDTSSGSLRLSGSLTEHVSAYAEGSVVQEQHQLPGSLTQIQVQQNRKQSTNPADDAVETYYTFNTGLEALPTDELSFNLDGGLSKKEMQADMASWLSYYDYQINGYTLSPKLTLLAPVASLDNELILGSDLSVETLNTKKFNDKNRAQQTTDTHVAQDLAGGYIANTLSLTEHLLLNLGARLEKNRVNVNQKKGTPAYEDGVSRTEEAWQMSLNWLPSDPVKLFAEIKRTFRYPFVDEQASYTGFGADALNKDLKPETGIHYETGVEFIPFSNLVLQATVFQTDMKDEISANAFWVNENLDETTHRGVELSTEYQNELVALNVYYTGLQSEFTAGVNNGNEIPWVPQNQFDLNLSLFLTDALTFNTHIGYIGSMYPSGDNANRAQQESDYTLTDLLLDYTLPVKKYKTTVFAGVDNLFETEYNSLVSYGGYYPAPGRAYKTGLRVTF